MNQDIRGKLEWFLRNLDYVIEDNEFEQKGIKIDLYFDAHEIIQLIAGIFYYYPNWEVKLDLLFQTEEGKPLRDRILVICLAYDGMLGRIKMLPPHQQEFLSWLNKDFLLSYVPASLNLFIQQFIRKVNHLEEIIDKYQKQEQENTEFTLEYVRKRAQSAMHFFKIIQLVRGVTWQSRLIYLRDQNILSLGSLDVEYNNLLDSDIFHKLNDALRKLRPQTWLNNYADALALTVLSLQLEKFKKKDSKTVPRLFISSSQQGKLPVLLQAVEQTELRESFMYETISGKHHLALRDSDFFVFKATLQNFNPQQEVDFIDPLVLHELRQNIYTILQSPNVLTTEIVNQIAISGRPLIQIVDDLNTFMFFSNVWIPSSRNDLSAVFEELNQATDLLSSDTFKELVDEEIRATKNSLEENIKEYQLISLFWGQIEEAVTILRKHFRGTLTGEIDYFRNFGLLRFAFPETSHERINSVLENLLFGNEDDEHSTHYKVISDCYLAHLAPDEKYIDNLVAAAAVLWVAKMYHQLTVLLEKISPLPHFSLELVYAAAIFETNKEPERGTIIIQRLESRSLSIVDPKERADLMVGLAYLYFHSWRRKGYCPVWDSLIRDSVKNDEIGYALVHRAALYAREAYKLLGEWDIKKKVYALNQYLYYLVMGYNAAQKVEITQIALELIQYKSTDRNQWWQYRFDDSLSRYFHLLSHLAKKEKEWEEYMDRALAYSKIALENAPWDIDIVSHNDRLLLQKILGFDGDRLESN